MQTDVAQQPAPQGLERQATTQQQECPPVSEDADPTVHLRIIDQWLLQQTSGFAPPPPLPACLTDTPAQHKRRRFLVECTERSMMECEDHNVPTAVDRMHDPLLQPPGEATPCPNLGTAQSASLSCAQPPTAPQSPPLEPHHFQTGYPNEPLAVARTEHHPNLQP